MTVEALPVALAVVLRVLLAENQVSPLVTGLQPGELARVQELGKGCDLSSEELSSESPSPILDFG